MEQLQKPEKPKIEKPKVEEPKVEKPKEAVKPEVKSETKAETKKVSADTARKYIGQSASALASAIGAPKSKDYAPGCIKPESDDGEWSYDGFTVYTIKYKDGKEEVYDVE